MEGGAGYRAAKLNWGRGAIYNVAHRAVVPDEPCGSAV